MFTINIQFISKIIETNDTGTDTFNQTMQKQKQKRKPRKKLYCLSIMIYNKVNMWSFIMKICEIKVFIIYKHLVHLKEKNRCYCD